MLKVSEARYHHRHIVFIRIVDGSLIIFRTSRMNYGVTPTQAANTTQSGNGKNASEESTAPFKEKPNFCALSIACLRHRCGMSAHNP